MKNFIIRLLIFILPVAMFVLVIEKYFTQVSLKHDVSNGEIRVWNDIFNSNLNADAYIYGSSKVWRGYDVPQLSGNSNLNFYSFGFDGHSFDLQYLRHKKLIENNPLPKLIVLNADIFTFILRTKLYQYEQFLPFLLDKKFEYSEFEYFHHFSKYDFYLPAVRYLGNLKLLLRLFRIDRRNEKIKRAKGYYPTDDKWNGTFEAVANNQKMNAPDVSTIVVAKFAELVKFCKEKDIKLVVVYSPEYFEVAKAWNNFNGYKAYIFEIIRSMDVQLLDFSSDPICFSKEYFYDSQHLNRAGAEVFTEHLIDSLLKYNYITEK